MPGRNEPCPCGSGKKYKRCCLSTDQDATDAQVKEEERERTAARTELTKPTYQPPKLLPEPVKQNDPRMQAMGERWKEFEKQNDEGRRTLFLKTLDEPDLMDDDQAFEMLSVIYYAGIKSNERDRFEELVNALREKRPEIYAVSRKYYVEWCIANAQALHQSDKVLKFSREMAEMAGDDVDVYGQVVDRLAYHGELDVLLEASRIAWPLIRKSTNIMWGQESFAGWGLNCVIFQRLANLSEHDDLRDPLFVEQLQFFVTNQRIEPIYELLDTMSGRSRRVWSIDEFDLKALERPTPGHDDDENEFEDEEFEDEDMDDDAKNELEEEETTDDELADEAESVDPTENPLIVLGAEFVGYACRHEGVPYTRAELARINILRYIWQRHFGELKPRSGFFEKPSKSKVKESKIVNPLCPDAGTLERFLAMNLNMMSMRPYDVAATFDMTPAWLRFLESRGLLTAHQRVTTLNEISKLQTHLLKHFEHEGTDLDLVENLRSWPENAARPCVATSPGSVAPDAATR